MIRTLAQLAVILALVFEVAVYRAAPGIGHLLFWLVALVTTVVANRSAERSPLPQAWMFLPSLGFALSVTLYDAGVVRFWSTALGLLSLTWAVGWNLIQRREAGALARLLPNRTLHLGYLWGAADDVWRPLSPRREGAAGNGMAIFRGILLTAPLLLLFGALLTSADAVFEKLLNQAFQGISLSLPLRIIFLSALFSAWLKLWLSSGPETAPHHRVLFGAIELKIALTALNALFATFLTVQAGYLFGGDAWVQSQGLNHAEYARSGFFELATCIALLLPLVMLAYQTAIGHQDSKLRWLGGGLILQAAGLAASAFSRMLLYIEAFGLSIERFYAASGILVALFVLALAAFACANPREVSWVVSRQTVTVLFLLSALSLVNVEDLIVRTNIERARQGKTLDLEYLRDFSCDAAPAIRQSESVITPQDKSSLLQQLTSGAGEQRGGLSWNLSRARAIP